MGKMAASQTLLSIRRYVVGALREEITPAPLPTGKLSVQEEQTHRKPFI